MADVAASLKDWSTTEASNYPLGTTVVSTGLNDNLQQIQASVRDVYSQDTIASAATCDIGSKDAGSLTVSGTTTITSLGTVSAGIRKWLTFSGVLTLTHNGSSLILPGAASITTAAGDTAEVESLGSGNWRCLTFNKASGQPVAAVLQFTDGTVSAPGIAFQSDTNTGIYRAGADSIGISAGGVNLATLNQSAFSINPTVSSGAMTATFSAVNSDAGASGTATVDIKAQTSSGSSNSATVRLIGGDSTANRPYITLTGSGSTAGGGSIAIRGGAIAAGLNGTGGAVNIYAGSTGSTLSTSHVGGELSMTSGTGYLSGNVSISAASTLINNTYKEYGKLTLAAGTTVGIELRQVTAVIKHSGTAPTITSGAGTGATISGTKNGFEVSVGTGAGTSIVIALQGAAGAESAPFAIAQCSANINCWCSTTDQQVTITLASAPSSGDKVRCFLMYV